MLTFSQYDLYDEKHQYTEVANATFVLIFKQWESTNFRTKYIKSIYPWVFRNNEIPLSCVKTKVSHIKRYKTIGDIFGISPKLIELYEALKDVDSYKLKNAIEQSTYGGYVNFYRLA